MSFELGQTIGEYEFIDIVSSSSSSQYSELLEKGWLLDRIFRFSGIAKVTQANADKAKALLRAEIHSFPQRQGDVGQFFARTGRRFGSMAACQNVEVACFQFEDHGTRYARFLAGSGPKLFRKTTYHGLRFR